jgi:hypothetical protein
MTIVEGERGGGRGFAIRGQPWKLEAARIVSGPQTARSIFLGAYNTVLAA